MLLPSLWTKFSVDLGKILMRGNSIAEVRTMTDSAHIWHPSLLSSALLTTRITQLFIIMENAGKRTGKDSAQGILHVRWGTCTEIVSSDSPMVTIYCAYSSWLHITWSTLFCLLTLLPYVCFIWLLHLLKAAMKETLAPVRWIYLFTLSVQMLFWWYRSQALGCSTT